MLKDDEKSPGTHNPCKRGACIFMRLGKLCPNHMLRFYVKLNTADT